MLKYKLRVPEISAVMWATDNYDEVIAFCPNIYSSENGSDLIIMTEEGNEVCKPFDYIVQDVENNFIVVGKEEFENKYEWAGH